MFIYLTLLFITIVIQIIVLGIIFSNLELDIEECDISYNIDSPKRFNIKKLKVNIKLYLFKRIKVLKIKIHKNYCEIYKMKINLNVLKKLKDDDERGIWYIFKNIWELKPEIKNIKFEIIGGTEDTLVTTFLIPIVSTIIFPIISKNMKQNNNNDNHKNELSNCNIKIIPRYINTNNLTLMGNLQINFDTIRTLLFIIKHRKTKV